MMGEHQEELARQRQEHERRVEDLEQKRPEEVEELTRGYEERIRGLRGEVSAADEAVNQGKIEAHQKQAALYQELFLRKEEIATLKYEVEKLQEAVSQGQKEVHFKQLEMEMAQQEHTAQLEQARLKFEEERLRLVR